MSDKIRALIIEDSENDLLLLLRALEKAELNIDHQHVMTADEVKEAMSEEWDVILADYRLEDYDGLDALKIVREKNEDVPFILVSRTIGDERAVEAMQAGVQDYVLKENLIRLAPAIQREVREARSRRNRRIAEEALLDRTRQLQAIVDTTPDLIARYDRQLRHLFVNQATCEATGIPFEDFIGRTSDELEMKPELIKRWNASLKAVFRSGKPRRLSFAYELPDGVHYYETLIAPEIVKDSKIQTLICNTRDMTREVALQTQLRQAQKMQAIGQLAGGIAHDFNNLLQVIGGNVELVIDETGPASPVAENLREISRATKRATNLVRQLLIFSRRDELELSELDLSQYLPQCLLLIRRVIGDHIELESEIEDGLHRVSADPGQIEQVLMNLCINSRDAMPNGGTLSVSLQNCVMSELNAERRANARPGAHVRLRVSDTGCGIPKKNLDRVFEPFFTTKETGWGTGLGLATVYGIVERHGGFIEVNSTVGEGATFDIYLPAHTSSQRQSKDPRFDHEPQPGEGRCVLLAEDDDQVRRLARSILERGGYEVIEARDGEEAIALFEKTAAAFDFAVVDVMMPKKNGDEVYRAIRAIRSRLPVLFTTGFDNEVIERQHLPEDQAALLPKPYSSKKLLAMIESLLSDQ
ncbi:response regulator [bacterium]|nr:response regulator [bacterium]